MKLPFLNFKTKKNDNEVLLALDIGTEYVKSVLFTIDSLTHKINVMGYGKCRQHSSAMQGAMIINMEQVINACDRSIGTALMHSDKYLAQKGLETKTPLPKKVIMGIAGELVEGVVILANYERDEADRPIDQAELSDVIANIKEGAFEDAVHDIAQELGVSPRSLIEINTKINSSYIDGVKVDNAIGFTGKNVDYRAYSTFAPSIHLNSMREIAKKLGLELVSVEVEPYVVARAMKNASSEEFSAIIIDIGGGTTDIAVVERGAIAGTRMFAHGGRVFTKRLAHDLEIDLHDAEKMKIEYGKGQMGHKAESDIKKTLDKDLKVWVEGVEIALSEIEDVEQFPDKILLCGGGSLLPGIRETLLEHPWLQVLPFYKFPKVEYIYPKQLEDIEDQTRTIIDTSDVTPLALARMMLEVNYNERK